MLFSIHEKSSRTLNTIIISRNELFSDKMNGSPSPHNSYRYSSTDISRFYAAYKHPDNESQTPLIVVSNSIFTLYKPNMNYRQNENTDRKSLTEGMLFHGGK
jgi:hypothetical protein